MRLVEVTSAPPRSLTASVYYSHNDYLGTPQVFTDENQNVVWRADYRPFGAVSESVTVLANNLRFPGQYFDGESGLHYNYFRGYDPQTGRYVQSDPIGLDGGFNTFGYVGGNPLRFIDPLGLHHHPEHKNSCAFGDYWCAGTGNQDITEEQKKKQDCVAVCVVKGTAYTEAGAKTAEAAAKQTAKQTAKKGAQIVVKKIAQWATGPVGFIWTIYACNEDCSDCENKS